MALWDHLYISLYCQHSPNRIVTIWGGVLTISHLRLRLFPRPLFKLSGKRLIVEEGPRVIKLVVEGPLEVPHSTQHSLELVIPDQTQKGGSGPVGFPGPPQLPWWPFFGIQQRIYPFQGPAFWRPHESLPVRMQGYGRPGDDGGVVVKEDQQRR